MFLEGSVEAWYQATYGGLIDVDWETSAEGAKSRLTGKGYEDVSEAIR